MLPSFAIILLIMVALKNVLKNKYAQAVLRGMKPCIIGIILATGIYMLMNNVFSLSGTLSLNIREIIIAAVLILIMVAKKKITHKKLTPIVLIMISACLGIVVFGI